MKMIIICLLTALLLSACASVSSPTSPATEPEQTTVPETTCPEITTPTVPVTSVPVGTIPTEPAETIPTEPPTVPTQPAPDEFIGALYTRSYLMQLDNTRFEYGCGYPENGAPPVSSSRFQDQYGKYNVHSLFGSGKEILLTFDCGYEPIVTDAEGNTFRYTEKMLDILQQKGVHAMFFVNLQFCKTCPDLVQRMLDEGHILGNHTASHIYLPDCSIDACAADIRLLQEYVQEHFRYTMKVFRPSSGIYSERTLALVQSLGFTTYQWSVAGRDWDLESPPPAEQYLETMVSRAHNGAVYLFHPLSPTTNAMMAPFIDELRAQGFTFVLPN